MSERSWAVVTLELERAKYLMEAALHDSMGFQCGSERLALEGWKKTVSERLGQLSEALVILESFTRMMDTLIDDSDGSEAAAIAAVVESAALLCDDWDGLDEWQRNKRMERVFELVRRIRGTTRVTPAEKGTP